MLLLSCQPHRPPGAGAKSKTLSAPFDPSMESKFIPPEETRRKYGKHNPVTVV